MKAIPGNSTCTNRTESEATGKVFSPANILSLSTEPEADSATAPEAAPAFARPGFQCSGTSDFFVVLTAVALPELGSSCCYPVTSLHRLAFGWLIVCG